jgi:hypothetical protein
MQKKSTNTSSSTEEIKKKPRSKKANVKIVVPEGCILLKVTLRDISNELLPVNVILKKNGLIETIEDSEGQMIDVTALEAYNKNHILFNQSQLTELHNLYGFKKA